MLTDSIKNTNALSLFATYFFFFFLPAASLRTAEVMGDTRDSREGDRLLFRGLLLRLRLNLSLPDRLRDR